MSDIIGYNKQLEKYLDSLNELDRACDIAYEHGSALNRFRTSGIRLSVSSLRVSTALRDHTVMKRVIQSLIRKAKQTLLELEDLDSNEKAESNGQR